MLPSRCSQLAVHEHAGQDVQDMAATEVARVRRGPNVGRHGPVARSGIQPRPSSPPWASTTSSQANTAQHRAISESVTTGVRRVGLASRSGITVDRRSVSSSASSWAWASWPAPSSARGAGDATGVSSGASSSRALFRPLLEIHHRVEGASASAAGARQPLEVRPLVDVAGDWYWPRYFRRTCRRRRSGGWWRRTRTGGRCACRVAVREDRRRQHRVVARRAELRVPGRIRLPARRRDHAADLAVLGGVDVAVDSRSVKPSTGRSVGRRRVRLDAGSRTRRWPGEDHDVLLGRVDDVEVVERGVEVGDEGRDVLDVVAPRGGVLDRIRTSVPRPSCSAGRQRQSVFLRPGSGTSGPPIVSGFGSATRPARPLARLRDRRRRLLGEIDAPHGLVGGVEDVGAPSEPRTRPASSTGLSAGNVNRGVDVTRVTPYRRSRPFSAVVPEGSDLARSGSRPSRPLRAAGRPS